jgi:signal transduction histidine kinase/DNA-binding response OmpR family regulator
VSSIVPVPFGQKEPVLGAAAPRSPHVFAPAPLIAGLCAALIGSLTVFGWVGHVNLLAGWFPTVLPMKFNAGAALIVQGTGLVLLGLRQRGTAAVLSGLVAAFMLSTLAEHLGGIDLGIDRVFFSSYASSIDSHPDRVSPLTAMCFALLGSSLVPLAFPTIRREALRIAGVGACTVVIISLVAVAGYVFNVNVAEGWGAFTRMSVWTAGTFFFIGTALLAWSAAEANAEGFNFLRWLPMSASLTLMAMIGLVSIASFTQAKRSADWRRHTYDVLDALQVLYGDVSDMQRGMRANVLTGQPQYLAIYEKSISRLEPDFQAIMHLTRDNPVQQSRGEPLWTSINDLQAYDAQLLELRAHQGLGAAVQMETGGAGFALSSEVVAQINAMTAEERQLLATRSAAAETDADRSARLLLIGSALAGALLIFATTMASLELRGRRRVELQLIAANEHERDLTMKAQAAERAKSEFLAVMSHEIRTPMNGVIGMTHILADTELDEMQADCVSTIQTSGESLMVVINDILDFSKIESGKMTLETRPFNVVETVEEALDLFSSQIRAKNLEGLYLIAPDVPRQLMGDGMRLRQVLVNLIGNAVKFTAHGEIVVNVELQGQDENGANKLLFGVSDTGIGIAPGGLDKLFRAFTQVDTSTTRKFGGTGLGLAISRRLAEMMRGTMWAESEPGKGSTFFFTAALPSAPVEAHNVAPMGPTGLTKTLSVLIVDDNATNRKVLQAQVRGWRMLSASASGAAEALALLAERTFDVALLDYQMPDVDGVTLARKIRETSSVPLVLLSSSGELIRGSAAALFQAQILKPIKQSMLLATIQRLTGTKAAGPVTPQSKHFDTELAASHPLRILLAEDNAINQKVGRKMLGQLGYHVDVAPNGREAVKAVAETSYDLVLMDIQMPEMDGLEATKLIREQMGPQAPHLVALTAEALEGDRERFLASGFDNYLSKPLQAAALQELLRGVPLGLADHPQVSAHRGRASS